MSGALLAARVVLAAVFAVAGLAKLADLAGSCRTVREFGVPDVLAPLLGSLLPGAELAVAVALIVRHSARWGAVGALVLLASFMVAIGVAMARGREPDCHCFGQLHSAPAGLRTLLRNGVLAIAAGFVAVAGWTDAGSSATGWIAGLSARALGGIGVGVLVVAAQAWFSWQLLRQNGRLIGRLDALEEKLGSLPNMALRGLPIGSTAPPFALPTPHAGIITLDDLLRHGRPVVLVFSDPACGPCTALLPQITAWQRNHEDQVTLALVSRGSRDAHAAIITEHQPRHIALQLDREVAEAYASPGTPSAVLIDSAGRIASQLAIGRDAIVELVERELTPALDASEQSQHEPSPAGAAPALVLSGDRHSLNVATFGG